MQFKSERIKIITEKERRKVRIHTIIGPMIIGVKGTNEFKEMRIGETFKETFIRVKLNEI